MINGSSILDDKTIVQIDDQNLFVTKHSDARVVQTVRNLKKLPSKNSDGLNSSDSNGSNHKSNNNSDKSATNPENK